MGEYRTERVGRLIQEKIGSLIIEGRIKDSRVNPFLSITRVSVSRDLAWAEVYVSTFNNGIPMFSDLFHSKRRSTQTVAECTEKT